MQQIEDWLGKLGMSEYAQRFAENGIDVSVLRHLTDQDLKDSGVLLGHRRKMLAAIAELGGAVSASLQPTFTEPKSQDVAERRRGKGKEDGLLSNKLALQRTEERFRQVVELAPNAIVMIGPTGLIEMINAETERVFGYTRNDLLGKPVEMLVPERYRPKHPGLRTSFFADPVSRPMGAGRDLYGLRRDGSEFPVEIGLNPIQTEEGTMVLSAIVDISGRKQLEERIHAINSMLRHEINQPLAAIVANAHAALRWLTTERSNLDEARAALKAIVGAGHRAGQIVRSFHSTLKKGSHRDQ